MVSGGSVVALAAAAMAMASWRWRSALAAVTVRGRAPTDAGEAEEITLVERWVL